ncbi:hypothetical protein QJS04_geneDACA010340 [Acorus gramineus]|uniref:Uncharacterized protein n=1 Tax=Acorus gramineus TaxID=55184 RepID=A0AAV9A5F6_ACOGR|nr:hypothetical protein QJS04_geneDACA010340 [Acorus gramineus]
MADEKLGTSLKRVVGTHDYGTTLQCLRVSVFFLVSGGEGSLGISVDSDAETDRFFAFTGRYRLQRRDAHV